jgi:putative hydrolase of the HAD superfamily
MNSYPVKAVFFDVVGTLIDIRGGVGRIYWDLAKPHGIRATPDEIDRAFARVFGSAPPLAFPQAEPGATRRLEKQWWHGVVSRVFEEVGPLERFDDYFESVFHFFSTPEGWEVYPDSLPVLSALKDRGLIVGVISNFDSRIYPLLSALGIFQCLDSVTISSRSGAAKPDARIFKDALSGHGLLPGESLHVGDSIREDVEGASGAGLRAVHIDRAHPHPGGNQSVIGSLRDLLPRLP